ncbi:MULTISPECIES: hypothetical protein [Sphingosinicellaceae]|uniref:hypothetical protein n=1 Tax=Sphingosinicellaceae TaxID=2820280 RepID=UPI001C1DDBAB|nr:MULTISPECIES: hypothetical protein [Polymorphobacter]QYE33021.1 hypothetical protein KZX46_02465 [Polymorphobacter sp. PAMC 29334]UAJ12260.1 hypothetical protein KTC28_20735 [Polymorphobacter megasporae]
MTDGVYYRYQTAVNNGWGPSEVLDVGADLNIVQQVALAANADGRLELFVIAGDFQVYHWSQTSASATSGWSARKALNITARQLAVARNSDGRLEFFYVGMDNRIYHNWPDNAGSDNWPGAWLTGASAKEVALAANADGRLELFYIGLDVNIYHNWERAPSNGPWDGAAFRGKARRLTLLANADGRLELIYVGMDRGLYHNWQTSPNGSDWGGGGSGATAAGLGGFGKDVTAIRNADGRLEIFYIGTNDGIYHNWQVSAGGGWNGESNFGGQAQQLSLCMDQDGRLELFYIGMDGNAYGNWQTAVNGPWTGVAAGFVASAVAATRSTDGRLVVAFQGGPTAVTGIAPTTGTLGSSTNYLLHNHGRPIQSPQVTLSVSSALAYSANGLPQIGASQVFGYSLQFNAYALNGQAAVWQQYIIDYDGTNLNCWINSWNIASPPTTVGGGLSFFVNKTTKLCAVPGGVAAGWNLTIQLATDTDERVTGATFIATDPTGAQKGKVTWDLARDLGVAAGNICPIAAYEVDLVGPGNSESVTLTGGAGTLHYSARTATMAQFAKPPGLAWNGGTAESSINGTYGTLPAAAAFDLFQSIATSTTAKVTPRLRPMVGHRVDR